MNDDPRLDLGALDAEADPARLERSARAIAARVAPSLRGRRRREGFVWLQLAGWRRPVLAAGALLAAASVVVIAIPRPGAGVVGAAAPTTLAEAAGLPAGVAGWLEGGAPLTSDVWIDARGTP